MLTHDVFPYAVNVTVELIAWNASKGPSVSHSSMYTIGALGSKQFLTFDLKDTLQEAGASPSDISKYFMQIRVRAFTMLEQYRLACGLCMVPGAMLMLWLRNGTAPMFAMVC